MNQEVNKDDSLPVERDEAGRVVPGSGSALGASSPRRSGTSEIARLRALITPEREALVAKLIEVAKSDDKNNVRAAEVLLDRLAARPRPTAELVKIEGLAQAQTLQGKADAIVLAVARGEVSADAGRALLAMMDTYARAVRVDELEARMRALEGRAPARGRVIEPETPAEPPIDVEFTDNTDLV